MKIFYCDICNAPMVLDEQLNNYKGRSSIVRKRRFKCTVCDFKKVIYGDGFMDNIRFPADAIKEVENNFKKEEENRKLNLTL